MKNILVTGSTGYIGSALVKRLEEKGYEVLHLSRKKIADNNSFLWNPESGMIDATAIQKADAIIHLAGENIGSGRWKTEKKRRIIDSRKAGTRLLIKTLEKVATKPGVFISASATGIYGAQTSEQIFNEDSTAASDFLGSTTNQWELESLKSNELGIRTVILRTGVVLSEKSKALQKIATPIRYFVGANIGSGKQYIPWIDLDDLVSIYIFALEQSISGIFNAVSPQHINQSDLNAHIAKKIKRPLIMPPIPEFILRLILGEMSVLVTKGSRVSSEKIIKAGFKFEYATIDSCLQKAL